jgi:hypothetical protein
LDPKNATYRCDLARALFEMGALGRSAEQYKKATKLTPGWMDESNTLAGQLLRSKVANQAKYLRALELASELCQATAFQNPQFLETLAAAYAANAQMHKARQTARTAIDLAAAAGQKTLADEIRQRAKDYETMRQN